MSNSLKKSKHPKYEIAGLPFATRNALEDYIRSIVERYDDGSLMDTNDQKFLEQLFNRHPDAESKKGSGIVSIEIKTNKSFYAKTRGFWINRVDGSTIDISWTKCIDGTRRSPRSDFEAAARCEIASQRQKFRDAFFVGKPHVTCPLTGETLIREKCHVDHVAPNTFKCLTEQWLVANGLRPEDIMTKDLPNGIDTLFSDRALAENWKQFHEQRATLRVISKRANLGLAKRKNV